MASPSGEIRLLIVEDVPQVAQYLRNLLTAQSTIKLLDIVTDGSKALSQIEHLRPDIALVASLLQGRIKGMALVDQIRRQDFLVPVVVLTVPQNPIELNPGKGIHGVLSMPFSGFDLMNKIQAIHSQFHENDENRAARVIAVFAPKGGVGKTTIAFNLAVSIGQLGQKTVLIDGSLQFGDLRALLKVPLDAPSILELPTDRIAESDLRDVLWRDPSGIDILLAPPRIEMAEMVTVRDIDKAISLLRRVYQVIVIDMASALSDINLAFLDSADLILQIVTYDSTTLHNTLAVAEAFRTIGYPANKIEYLINRSDSGGGMTADDLRRSLGRTPEHSLISDGLLVVQSNNEGVPFVLANPNAVISQDIAKVAALVAGTAPRVAMRR